MLSNLTELLTNHCDGIDSIDTADGVKTGLEKIKLIKPDLVFLDIEMEDGTGFDLIQRIELPLFQLVFVTAHDKYAIDAFKFSAIDYLLKPVDKDDLVMAYQKAQQLINKQALTEQIEVLKSALNNLNPKEQKIVLKDHKSIYFIPVQAIYNCEAQGAYTSFHIKDQASILVSKPLKEYATILEPFGFLRCHHSHLVNTSKIIRLDKSDGGVLILDNGTQVPISQRKWDYVLQILDK